MSTVLWMNALRGQEVASDDTDLPMLYRHTDKLDALCRKQGLPELSSICGSTDMQINIGALDLPQEMESSDQLMARQGIWTDASAAVDILGRLLGAVRESNMRFGVLRNDHDAVVAELKYSLAFARKTAESGGKFNFCVVA